METYWLLLLLPLAAIGGWMLARYDAKHQQKEQPVTSTWFKGLNFLLNEQPDKALEVFLAATQVDENTWEMHLALGNLFRRQGDVDRATRIHQNLVANPDLDPQLQSLALFELAQDYFKAGLYDRAENLLLEIREKTIFREQAGKLLLQIYDQEKEWASAILIAENLHRISNREYSEILSQYCCELAEQLISVGRNQGADEYLKRSLAYRPDCVRAIILSGRLSALDGNHAQAIMTWKSLQKWSPESLGEVVDHMANSYKAKGDKRGYKSFLEQAINVCVDTRLISAYVELVRHDKGKEAGQAVLLDWVRQHPTLEGLHQLVKARAQPQVGQQEHDFSVLADLLYDIVNLDSHYRCRNCGFNSKSLHWQCPGCKGWATIAKNNGIKQVGRQKNIEWLKDKTLEGNSLGNSNLKTIT